MPKNVPIDEFEEDDGEVSEDDGEEVEGGYQPLDELRPLHWHRRAIKDLIEMMGTPYLDLNPEYQREVVWTPERMTKLINSLQGNYYVPPLIFNVYPILDSEGKSKYMRVSIDGKQRLSSIRAFVTGSIPCTDKKNRRWYFCDNGDKGNGKKRLLPEKQRKRFLDLELLTAEYSGLERKQEEDLFSRVQLGMPLTPAEKLRASSGKWQKFAIDIENAYSDLMEIFDNRRGRGFQLILQVLRQLLNADDIDPKYSAGASSLKAFCDRDSLLDENIRTTARRVFDVYNEIKHIYPSTFEDHNYQHAKKFSPIEFVGVAVLIHRYPDRNIKLLSQDVVHLRRWLRERRQDLRSNTQTWKEIMHFITNLPQFRGGVEVREARRSRAESRRRLLDGTASASEGATELDNISENNIEDSNGEIGRSDISTQDAAGRVHPPTPKRSPPAVAPKGRAGNPKTFDLKRCNSILGGPQVKRESIVNGHPKFQQPKSPTLPDPISATPTESPLFLPASSLASSQSRASSVTPAPTETLNTGPRSPILPIAQNRPSNSGISSRFRAVASSQNLAGGDRNMRKRGPDDADDINPPVKKEKMVGPFSMD